MNNPRLLILDEPKTGLDPQVRHLIWDKLRLLKNVGVNVYPCYFSQHAMDILEPRKTVLDTLQDAMPQAHMGTLRNLCAAFLFQGDDIYKRIDKL